jgi:hypothetical protein
MISVGQKDKGKPPAAVTSAFASSSNKYQAPVATRHTVKRKESITVVSKTVRSVNRTDDWDGAEEVPKAASAPQVEDDVEEDEDFDVPPGFFDDPDQIETQPDELIPAPAPKGKTRAASRPVKTIVPDSDIEDDDEPTEGGFTGQFKKLKSLRAKVRPDVQTEARDTHISNQMAERFVLNDPDEVFQEEVLQELALLECTSQYSHEVVCQPS